MRYLSIMMMEGFSNGGVMEKLRQLFQLFWTFLKVGSFTFGGGYAMLPLIQREVVDNRRWVTEEEIVDIFAITQAVPGIISINSAIFIGNKVAAISGAVAAALGMILPAFFSILVILIALMKIKDNIYVEKVMAGIRAASAALILLSAIKLGKTILKGKNNWFIAIAAFGLIIILNVNAAWAVVLGGTAGYLTYCWNRRKS
jgi:chromate transporter